LQPSIQSKELFEILVRENSRMLTTYLRAVGCDDALLDDVWQETMIVAWRKLDEFDRSKPFGPWLRGIAARTLMASRRAASRFVLTHDVEALEYLNQKLERLNQLSGDTLDEKLDALRDCVAKLNNSDRECIELRFRDDMMPAAMSERIGVALETVKKRLFRAKQQLQACLELKLARTDYTHPLRFSGRASRTQR
jgi:RNA polymerase sigma-70 factor (ECF subfamily)